MKQCTEKAYLSALKLYIICMVPLRICFFITVFYVILLFAIGELPKRLKGAVSKTARRESVRGFKSLILRHHRKNAESSAFLFCQTTPFP